MIGNDKAESNIPLGPALIAWAVLAGGAFIVAGLVWFIHTKVATIPGW